MEGQTTEIERGLLIGQVARAAGVTKDTVRFYERAGLLSSREREAGTRVYKEFGPEMVERLAAIKQGQAAGFSLREIKEILDEWGDNVGAMPREQIMALSERKIADIDEKLHHLQAARAYLVAKVERLRAGTD